MQVNGEPLAFLRKNKEDTIYDCMMDYMRLQVTSGMYKKGNVSNISRELFDKNAAVFAFDLTCGDISAPEEVSKTSGCEYILLINLTTNYRVSCCLKPHLWNNFI